MKINWLVILISTAMFASTAQTQDWVKVSTKKQLDELGPDVTAVELVNVTYRDPVNLLTALADSPRIDIKKLKLKARAYDGIGPLDRLADFTNLVHLEIHDSDANLCSVNKGGASQVDSIVKLTNLEMLVIESG